MAHGVSVGNGGNKSVPTIHVGNGGAKRVLQAYVGTPGGNKTVFFGLDPTASPASASAPIDGVQTNSVTVSTPGGKSPINFVWSFVSGSTVSISATSGPTVFWTVTSPRNANAVWQCQATDGHGSQVSVQVNVAFSTNA